MATLRIQGISVARLKVIRAAIDIHTHPKNRKPDASDADVVNDYVAQVLGSVMVETETRLVTEIKRAEARQALKDNPL